MRGLLGVGQLAYEIRCGLVEQSKRVLAAVIIDPRLNRGRVGITRASDSAQRGHITEHPRDTRALLSIDLLPAPRTIDYPVAGRRASCLWRKNGFSTSAQDSVARTSDAAIAVVAENALPTKPNPTMTLITGAW